MASLPPNSLAEIRIHGQITDDPVLLNNPSAHVMSYKEMADAVVRGCSIVYARIHDLRKLIEAVQIHRGARLAPPRSRRGEKWSPPDDESDNALTAIEIYGGEVVGRGTYQDLDVRLPLTLSTHFAGDALFDEASFAGDASFGRTNFAGTASFFKASFAGVASFISASFVQVARFDGANFAKNASFALVRFAGGATFYSARFIKVSRFNGTHFALFASFIEAEFRGGTWFDNASFAGSARFGGASFRRNASFDAVTVTDSVDLVALDQPPRVLDVRNLNIRPGGVIKLDYREHLRREDQRHRHPPKEDPWMIERDHFSHWIASLNRNSPFRWVFEYLSVVLWMRHPLLRPLGVNVRGDVIRGERADSLSEPKVEKESPDQRQKRIAGELRSAEQQYRILRDNFRSQPSCEEHEDLCHFRYMELKRRAEWWEDPPLRRRSTLFLEWLVMRNMLGYMIYPVRIMATGAFFLLLFAAIFGIFASGSTITHGSAADPIALWKSDWLNPLYFSLMTFVTLGYGDFAPLGWFKLLCGLEGLLGVTLLALFTVAWGRRMIR